MGAHRKISQIFLLRSFLEEEFISAIAACGFTESSDRAIKAHLNNYVIFFEFINYHFSIQVLRVMMASRIKIKQSAVYQTIFS